MTVLFVGLSVLQETKAPAALATRDNKSSSCMEHKKRPKEQRSIASFFNKK